MSPGSRASLALTLAVALSVATVFSDSRQTAAPIRDLTNPAALTEPAPASFLARFDTTAGPFTIRVTRTWAPNGADRFYNLVKAGFYDQCRFFRVVPGFVVQFGLHGDPAVSAAWATSTIRPDRARVSNTRGRITFAMSTLVTTRATQVFVNYGDNSRKLDVDGFAPFGEVITGMVMLDRVYDQYGEGPDPAKMMLGGNAYLAQVTPRLDYIRTAVITDK